MLGFRAMDKLIVNGGIDIPMYITPNVGTFTVPLLFGGGAEYALSDALEVTGRVRLGPALELTQNAANRFAMELLVGVAYRL